MGDGEDAANGVGCWGRGICIPDYFCALQAIRTKK